MKSLNQGSESYWEKAGRYPATMQELRASGLVQANLEDPRGFPYVMGEYGVPQLNPQSPIVMDADQKLPQRTH